MNDVWEVGPELMQMRFKATDCADSVGEIHYVVGNSKRNRYFVVNSALFNAKGNGKIDFVAFPRRT